MDELPQGIRIRRPGLNYAVRELWLRRRGREIIYPACPKCFYCVRELAGTTCPECGADLMALGAVSQPNRRWVGVWVAWMAVWSLAVYIIAGLWLPALALLIAPHGAGYASWKYRGQSGSVTIRDSAQGPSIAMFNGGELINVDFSLNSEGRLLLSPIGRGRLPVSSVEVNVHSMRDEKTLPFFSFFSLQIPVERARLAVDGRLDFMTSSSPDKSPPKKVDAESLAKCCRDIGLRTEADGKGSLWVDPQKMLATLEALAAGRTRGGEQAEAMPKEMGGGILSQPASPEGFVLKRTPAGWVSAATGFVLLWLGGCMLPMIVSWRRARRWGAGESTALLDRREQVAE